MSFKPYNLDKIAQELVLKYRDKDVLNESHKMRMTIAYGLERFWGEQLRLRGKNESKTEGKYWTDVWDALTTKILHPANILLPENPSDLEYPPDVREETKEQKKAREERNTPKITVMASELWDFGREHPQDQRIALAILTQLCDSLVWWTQRYKP